MIQTVCDRCGRLVATDQQLDKAFVWHRRTPGGVQAGHFDLCGSCDIALMETVHDYVDSNGDPPHP